uniref:Uncharacterized protein n=2 Tax=viral metagenome TaxID=1070528 RepID=A0A6M3M9T3_9ZZZZ
MDGVVVNEYHTAPRYGKNERGKNMTKITSNCYKCGRNQDVITLEIKRDRIVMELECGHNSTIFFEE